MNEMDTHTNPTDDLLFLTPQEVDYLQDVGSEPPGFIADFVEWAGKQSDASPYALSSGALLALSLAAGEAVQARGLFGSNVYLNLYVLIVGPSTIVRKTTVLNMVRKVLPLDGAGNPFVNFEDDFAAASRYVNRRMVVGLQQQRVEAAQVMGRCMHVLEQGSDFVYVDEGRSSHGAGLGRVLGERLD